MFRARVPLQMAKMVMQDSKANLNTQQIVDKTKSVIQNAVESTKDIASEAKEKLVDTLGMQKAEPEFPRPGFQDRQAPSETGFAESAKNAAQQAVETAKNFAQNAADKTKEMVGAATKENNGRAGVIFDEAFKPTATQGHKSTGQNPNDLKEHGLTEQEREGNQCAVGSCGPQVGVDDKMSDVVQEHLNRVNHPQANRS